MMGNKYPTGYFKGEDCSQCPCFRKRKCIRKGYCENHLKGASKKLISRFNKRR